MAGGGGGTERGGAWYYGSHARLQGQPGLHSSRGGGRCSCEKREERNARSEQAAGALKGFGKTDAVNPPEGLTGEPGLHLRVEG